MFLVRDVLRLLANLTDAVDHVEKREGDGFALGEGPYVLHGTGLASLLDRADAVVVAPGAEREERLLERLDLTIDPPVALLADERNLGAARAAAAPLLLNRAVILGLGGGILAVGSFVFLAAAKGAEPDTVRTLLVHASLGALTRALHAEARVHAPRGILRRLLLAALDRLGQHLLPKLFRLDVDVGDVAHVEGGGAEGVPGARADRAVLGAVVKDGVDILLGELRRFLAARVA